jgi:hypothetical protein
VATFKSDRPNLRCTGVPVPKRSRNVAPWESLEIFDWSQESTRQRGDPPREIRFVNGTYVTPYSWEIAFLRGHRLYGSPVGHWEGDDPFG